MSADAALEQSSMSYSEQSGSDALYDSQASCWLDTLPIDILEQLGVHVSGGKRTESALQLAQTSDKLKRAVLSSFDYTFVIPRPCMECREWLEKWARLFVGHVEKLLLNDSVYLCVNTIEALVLSHSLLKWTIRATSLNVLDMLSKYSWGHVETQLGVFSIHARDRTLDAVDRIAPRKLHFAECSSYVEDSGHFYEFENDEEDGLLSYLANRLESVPIIEYRGCFNAQRERFWLRLFTALSCRGQILLSEVPPSNLIAALRQLDDVKIDEDTNIDEAVELEELGGAHVSQLELRKGYRGSVMSSDQFLQLPERFPGLRKLAVEMEEGYEAHLDQVLRGLPLLSELALSWKFAALENAPPETLHELYQPQAGKVQSAIENCPNLTSLRLSTVNIETQEMLNIFELLGTKLRQFGFSVRDSSEEACEVVLGVLAALMTHCPNLRNVIVDTEDDPVDTDDEDEKGNTTSPQDTELPPPRKAALMLMKQKMPTCDDGSVRRFFTKVS